MESEHEFRIMVKRDFGGWVPWVHEGVYNEESPEWEKIVRNLRAETTWQVRLERRRVMWTGWREVGVEA